VTAAPDATEWDAFVEGSDPGSYLQLRAWARVKAVNGWTSHVVRDGDRVGAQILVRRPRPLPWGFGYAPRGPVARDWSADGIGSFTALVRDQLTRSAGRVSHVRIDPEIEVDAGSDAAGAVRHALATHGWRPAPPIQPSSTRVIDLAGDEDALFGELRKKWRQYVNKARNGGIRVVEAEGDRLPEFYRIYRETADRAGFLIRAESAYRDVWEAYRPAGRARLLFAETADGEPQATLFLVRCGPRVVEPYGGMTQAGGETRANYLLKWEAIRTSKEQGATTYDLWGLATGGIAHFKTGFGGREVRYIGAYDLTLDRLGREVYARAGRARVWMARRRHGLGGSTASASAYQGDADG
jgi:peptidoglycan pentaglycine glycine transferase (the first glycine)